MQVWNHYGSIFWACHHSKGISSASDRIKTGPHFSLPKNAKPLFPGFIQMLQFLDSSIPCFLPKPAPLYAMIKGKQGLSPMLR